MENKFLLIALLTLSGPAFAEGTSVKVYGVKSQADLSVLSAVTPSISTKLCDIFTTTNCSATSLSWARIADDGSGNVKNPGDGTMDTEGWMYADQFVQISGVSENDPGWVLDIYTENLVGHPTPYTGALKSVGAVNGLVSGSTSPGTLLIPLNWKITPLPITDFKTTDSAGLPMPEEIVNPTGGSCAASGAYLNSTRINNGFCDYSTHYMGDLGDRTTDQAHTPTWWQDLTAGTPMEIATKEYQSILSSDGAANLESYRLPYSTLTGIGTYDLYIGAKFAQQTIRDKYQTTIFLNLVAQ